MSEENIKLLNEEKVENIRENRDRVMKKIGDIISGKAVKKKAKPVVFSMYVPPQEAKHTIGEKWTDADGYEWEQYDGYRMRLPRIDVEDMKGYRMPYACPRCQKPFNYHLDKKMWWIHRLCFDCVQDFETELRATGKYKEYERQKIMANMRAYYVDVMNGLSDYINSFDTTIIDGNGEIEKWDRADKALIKSMVLEDLSKFRESFKQNFNEQLENEYVQEKMSKL